MQYSENTIFERTSTLNYGPEIVYPSLKNINRLHKWHPFLYFSDPGPNMFENVYKDLYGGEENGYVVITNSFNMIDGDIFLRTLIFLQRSLGDPLHTHAANSNRIHIEFERVPGDENKTNINLKRKLILIGNIDSSEENRRTVEKQFLKTDAVFNALNQLEIGTDGLLFLKNKPSI